MTETETRYKRDMRFVGLVLFNEQERNAEHRHGGSVDRR